MGSRLNLQSILETVLGSKNVYFQPPPGYEIKYPCIVYGRTSGLTQFANNKPYINRKRYQVTVIDRNPDSAIPDKVASLPTCIFDRAYPKDNLNHSVYNLYY